MPKDPNILSSGRSRKIPNRETQAAMAEADEILRARHARFEAEDRKFRTSKKPSANSVT